MREKPLISKIASKAANVGLEYWIKLFNSIEDRVADVVNDINSFSKFLNEILEKYIIKLEVGNSESDEVGNRCVVGIDSSCTPPIRIGPYIVSAISYSIITFEKGIECEPRKRIGVELIKTPESASPEYAEAEYRLSMFELEAKALRNVVASINENNCKPLVLIDGPIVDPPRFRYGDKGLKRRYEDYVRDRASAIKYIIENGGVVVGIIKRIEGNMAVKIIEKEINRHIDLNDHTLISMSFYHYVDEYVRRREVYEGRDLIILFNPFELPPEGTDYLMYSNYGIKIYTTYVLPGIKGRVPIRIEVPVLSDNSVSNYCGSNLIELIKKVAMMIYSVTIEGQRYPLPIVLAHRSCTIPKRTAKKLLREVLARYLLHVLKDNIDVSLAISLASWLMR